MFATGLLKVDYSFDRAQITRLAAGIARFRKGAARGAPWSVLISEGLRRAWSEAHRVRAPYRLGSNTRGAKARPREAARPNVAPSQTHIDQKKAPSLLSPRAVMTEAWRIFRTAYNYPYVPFRSIGRPCFVWALNQACANARHQSYLVALGPEALTQALEQLSAEETALVYLTHGSASQRKREMAARRATLRQALVTALGAERLSVPEGSP